jgi:hypothetical protein
VLHLVVSEARLLLPRPRWRPNDAAGISDLGSCITKPVFVQLILFQSQIYLIVAVVLPTLLHDHHLIGLGGELKGSKSIARDIEGRLDGETPRPNIQKFSDGGALVVAIYLWNGELNFLTSAHTNCMRVRGAEFDFGVCIVHALNPGTRTLSSFSDGMRCPSC